jgi:arabinofuranan 3-O-arabinosyltransferase
MTGSSPAQTRAGRVGLVGLALWTVLLLVTVLNSAGMQVLDIKPEIYFAPERMRWFFLGAWQPSPQLGFPNFNVGLAPVAWLVSGIAALGVGPDMSVRVLRLGLYTVGAWGAARLYRDLVRLDPDQAPRGARRLRIGGLVAAVAFVANPYAVVGGSTLAVLLPYALLPWQCLCLVRALREPRSWRWPAGFALCFFAMSGMNAGVVPLLQLVSVPVLVVVVRRALGLHWRQLVRPLLLCAALTVAVSLYWVVPSLFAVSEGQAVLDNSETLQGISGPSSFAEVLRGLGFWPMYGSGPGGPWVPGFAPFLSEPVVVALSFGVLVGLAWAVSIARGPVRRLGVALVAVAAVVMVGLYPFSDPSPMGRVLRWAFEHVSALGAFRTTNKAGSVLVLGGCVVVAWAAAAWWSSRRPTARVLAVLAALAVLVGGTYPAFAGGLYPRTFDVPQYWHDAAAAVDAGRSDQRVWFVPGQVQAQYRWAAPSPDDLALPLFSRPTVLRTTLPVASPYAANFLAAVDTQIQEGSLAPGTLSTLARYLGVGDVLVRNDTVWEQYQGARPWTVQQQVSGDPGLEGMGNFGAPGENTASPLVPYAPAAEGQLPPLQDFRVKDAQPIVRAESLRGSVVVDGDGFAFAPMAAAGLLSTQPTVRLAGDVGPAEFATLLGPDHRLVLTDTNRRTDTVLGRLANNQGPLLSADAQPASGRALFGPVDQTTLEVYGGARVTASMVGSVFGTLAEAVPENAFDGDPATSWQFGDFGTAVGQHIDVALDSKRSVETVDVTQAAIGPVRIGRVRIDFGGTSRVVQMPATGSLAVPLGASGDHFRLTVLSTVGDGYNRVGVSEIDLAGLRLTRVARMPDGISRLAASLSPAQHARLDATPLDIVLSRVRGASGPLDDAETAIQRDFELPDARSYRLYGLVAPGRGLTDADYDVLAGLTGPVSASATSMALGLPLFRASLAVDGDPNTAWVPSEPVVGESITVHFPSTSLDHIDLTQAPVAGTNRLDGWATSVRIALDGRVVAASAPVGPGTDRIDIPVTRATSLTLTILGRSPAGQPVRISEIGIGGRVAAFSSQAASRACVTVATIDGEPVRMHPLAPVLNLDPQLFGTCPGDPGLSLAAGAHELRSDGRWIADTLVMRDRIGETVVAPGTVPVLDVQTGHGSSVTVHADATDQPWLLVSGQSHDLRWQAQEGGHSLGRPLVADGYAAGWVVPAGGPVTVTVTYGPQRPTDAALAVSGLAVLVCLVLVLAPLTRRRTGRAGAPLVAGAESSRSKRHADRRVPPWLTSTGAAVVAVALAWFVADWTGAVAAGVAVTALVVGVPARRVIQAGLLLAAAVPVVWLVGNRDRIPAVTVDLVQQVPWAGRLAAAALVLLVVGVVAQDRADRPGPRRPFWKTAPP